MLGSQTDCLTEKIADLAHVSVYDCLIPQQKHPERTQESTAGSGHSSGEVEWENSGEKGSIGADLDFQGHTSVILLNTSGSVLY